MGQDSKTYPMTPNELVEPDTDVEGEEEQQESLRAIFDKYIVYQNYPDDDYDDSWRVFPDEIINSQQKPTDGSDEF